MSKNITGTLLLVFFSLTHFVSSLAQTTLSTRTVATNLTTPWEIIWGPDNWIWMTEKLNGQICRINPETGQKILLHTISEVSSSVQESGLLGMVLHPDFQNTPHVFVAYNYRVTTPYLKIVRFTYNAATGMLTDPTIIQDQIPTGGNHHGCRLLIVGDKLFATTGDAGGSGSAAQNPASLNGKVLRLNLNGTVPADNPISGNPLWTLGHRNAQGLIYVPLHNNIYISEHGGTDEINIIKGGARNYAWPLGSGICQTQDCKNVNAVQPIIPNRANLNPLVAPSGIDYYNHDAIPEWKNSILLGNLAGQNFIKLQLNTAGDSVINSQPYFADTYGRIRDICVAPDGRVFICTSNKDQYVGTPGPTDDRIIEIKNSAFNPPSSSSQKSILAFRLLASGNPGLNADLTGEIVENETPKKIKVNIPAGLQITLSSLTPAIVISSNATISLASGIAANFTTPVMYTVTAQDGSTQQYMVTVTQEGITGIEAAGSSIKVFPNPFLKSFEVEGAGDAIIELFDSHGKKLLPLKITATNHGTMSIQAENIRPGVYYLHIKTSHGTIVRKIVKR